MKKYCLLVFIVAATLSANGMSADTGGNDEYVSGSGVITISGPTGMFINPTSGIAVPKGGVTAQACLAALPVIENTEHTILMYFMAAHAPLDWLEFGFHGISAQQNSDTHLGAWGGQVRGRVLKDDKWWPEVSLGASIFDGNRAVTRRDIYGAMSKLFEIHDGNTRIFTHIRFHTGFRYLSSQVAPDDTIVFGGGEIRILPGIWAVGEVQAKDDDVDRFQPYAFGLQGRSKNGWAFTVAGVQTGGAGYFAFPGAPGAQGVTGGVKKPAIYVGIGASFF